LKRDSGLFRLELKHDSGYHVSNQTWINQNHHWI
jgi:hypothetical protein